MQLRHYSWLICRWLWLILLGTAICSGATYVISKRIAPTYEASALLQVNGPGTGDSSTVFSDQALALAYSLQVTNNDVLQEVAKELPVISVERLKKEVSASPLESTQVIQVRTDDTDPKLAADITNTVVKVFLQQQRANETARLQTISSQITANLTTVRNNINAAQARLAVLQNANAPKDQITQQNDDLSTYRDNYNALLTSYNQVELQKILVPKTLNIVQSAIVPNQPLNSRLVLNTVIAALLSLLLMISFALLMDWVDSTIKTPEDVAHLTALEALGSVPLYTEKTKLRKSNPLDKSTLEQAFTTIVTNFSAMYEGRRAILVTGMHPGDGASTISASLANDLAASGLRVLLVDANMRNPSLHKMYNASNKKGLADIIDGSHPIRPQADKAHEWFQQWTTDVSNLWLLPVGSDCLNSTRLLLSPKLRTLVEWLLRQPQTSSDQPTTSAVDIIIFDAPALDESPDATTLALITDGTILVVEAGKQQGATLNKAQTTLRRLGSPIIGVVVNRRQARHRSYFYAHSSEPHTIPLENKPEKYPLLQARALALETPQDLYTHQDTVKQPASSVYNGRGDTETVRLPPASLAMKNLVFSEKAPQSSSRAFDHDNNANGEQH